MTLLLLFNQPPYFRVLLDTARQLQQQNHREIVVVTAQMACEIFTEQVFAVIYQKRGLSHLEEPLHDLLRSYNLANDKVRGLYVALTGDPIQNQPFWPRYKEVVTLRNNAVHAGLRASSQQAVEACDVAEQLVAHLSGVVKNL